MLVLAAAYTVLSIGGVAVESVMCGQMMAWRSLKKETWCMTRWPPEIQRGAEPQSPPVIVGRDTKDLTDPGNYEGCGGRLWRENTSDGIIAPLFLHGAGGGTGIFLYKAVSHGFHVWL